MLLPIQILLRSQLQLELTRFLTQQAEGDGFFVKTPQVSVLSLLNLGFAPLFLLLLKDLYKSCCCTFIVTPFHLRLG